jgi:hypothetical protein
MIRGMVLILIAVAAVTMAGCKKEPAPSAEPAEVKVTPENLDSELDKMESQIEADIAAEQ